MISRGAMLRVSCECQAQRFHSHACFMEDLLSICGRRTVVKCIASLKGRVVSRATL